MPAKCQPRVFPIWSACLILFLSIGAAGDPQSRQLVTGPWITPAAGGAQDVGSLPVNVAISPDGKWAITTDAGYRESLWSIDTATGLGKSHLEFNRDDNDKTNGLFYGLAVSDDGTVYAAQGAHDSIARAALAPDGTLTSLASIAAKPKDFPAGLALDGRGYLYVTNYDPGDFQKPSSVSIYDLKTAAEVGRYNFEKGVGGQPNYPLAIAVLKTGDKTFVASERDGCVYALDTHDPAKPTLAGLPRGAAILTGAHPDALLLNRLQDRLYVANAQSDSVSVVDVAKDSILRTIALRPANVRMPITATPTGLSLSTDEKLLYVSLADMNAVAVVDLAKGSVDGYIPAGWYPAALAAVGQKLLVVNAKGDAPWHPNPEHIPGDKAHVDLNVIEGRVDTIDIPDQAGLKKDSEQVLANDQIVTGNLPRLSGKRFEAALGLPDGVIQHVIYVIKENRTYDQVLGDVAEGNGDPSLAIFGHDVTPNQHALAERFVLLDNFYDCGEVSGDGWQWSTQSMANEFSEKTVPYTYSNRDDYYDYEGMNDNYITAGFPAVGPDGRQNSLLYAQGAPPVTDIAEAGGRHIWDVAEAAHLTYRNYGFFYSFGDPLQTPDNYPTAAGLQPPGRDLAGVSDYDFRRFDRNYPDSNAPSMAFDATKDTDCLYSQRTYGSHNAVSRFAEWRAEFMQMLTDDPMGGSVPALMTIRFPSDHTAGLKSGQHSPRSMVADNDYAVGELVQTVSESYIWRNTVIFILEDDAQDGPDHVDCHRSTCYIVSPMVRPKSIDHSFYNTDSVLHTIEALLHLPSMTRYDATAPLMRDFVGEDLADNDSYTAIPEDPKIIAERNPDLSALRPGTPAYHLARLSSQLDFVHPDSAPASVVNEMIWKSVRGVSAKMPPIHHGAVYAAHTEHGGDAD